MGCFFTSGTSDHVMQSPQPDRQDSSVGLDCSFSRSSTGFADVSFAFARHSESRDTLLNYCRFAETHDLHLVVDEVYGMSVFSTGGMLV